MVSYEQIRAAHSGATNLPDARISTTPPDGLHISLSFSDAKTQAHLTGGGRVPRLPELDDTPRAYRAIIQVIENFDRNHKVGLVFETKVGQGSLRICSIDLPALQNIHPEARPTLDPAILRKLIR